MFALLNGGSTGTIKIKCPICRGVVAVSLHNYDKQMIKDFAEPIYAEFKRYNN